MLTHLSIRNFILIENLDLELGQGMNVFTGETGSGKSLILSAILFALGQNIKDVVSPGASQSCVTIIFEISNALQEILEQQGIEILDNQLIIKRVQNSNARKNFFINDQIVTQKTIQELSSRLLDIYAQHSQTKLLNPLYHMNIVDKYIQNASLIDEVRSLYLELSATKSRLAQLQFNKEKNHEEIEYLEASIEELTKLEIQEGEEDILLEKRTKITNQEKELQTLRSVIYDLEKSEIEAIIAKSQRAMLKRSNERDEFEKIFNKLEDLYNLISDLKTELETSIQNIREYDESLENLDDRLEELRAASRKYRRSVALLPSLIKEFQEKYETLKQNVSDMSNLQAKTQKLEQEYLKKTDILSKLRSDAASSIEKIVRKELSDLGMPKAVFAVEVTKTDLQSAKGLDVVRFLAATNPGLPLSPIEKVASGGEISRFLLGLSVVFYKEFDNAPCSILFDEIDAGTSGSVASSIGEKLKNLSMNQQILVITHLPQVASKAQNHFLITKVQQDNKTHIDIKKLAHQDKIREVARMISGSKITDAALAAAEEFY